MLDSVVLYEFNHLALLQIGDAKVPLPCREEVWHCGTADMITDEKYRPGQCHLVQVRPTVYIDCG